MVLLRTFYGSFRLVGETKRRTLWVGELGRAGSLPRRERGEGSTSSPTECIGIRLGIA